MNIFGGRKFAQDIEHSLQGKLVGKKIVAIVDPQNAAGLVYTGLKKQMAKRLGVQFEINDLIKKIRVLNIDPSVDGIMIQLPYPNSQELIKLIDPQKDIDGLREDSPYQPAVVRAIKSILDKANYELGFMNKEFEAVIVGSKGRVGRKLHKSLLLNHKSVLGMDKEDFDPERSRRADVIISCAGQAGLIKPEMIKDGAVCIDVGYPKGDFDPECSRRASFFTPVPGGVGPVTVASLFTNLLLGKSRGNRQSLSE